jgi:dihydroneopterin aldolase
MQHEAGMTGNRGAPVAMDDMLVLEIEDLEVDVLTGIYSEETHLPQPLRISVRVLLDCAPHYGPDSPLNMSKNYMDLKHAATAALTQGQHFTLIEAVADHIIETVFLQDGKARHATVKIVKLALSERHEKIGITLSRWRK